MMRYLILLILFLGLLSSCKSEIVELYIVETTDLHGHFLNYNFATDDYREGSLSQVAYYVDSLRKRYNEILLLDNGDILQGDPLVYYSNYIQSSGKHIVTRMLNFLNYDAITIGNHDIETGFDVFDHLFRNSKVPWLAANVVQSSSKENAYAPYVIVYKKGVKIAIVGLTTPGIPNWLPEKLYKGLEFQDMVAAAKVVIEDVKRENPDLIVGLFHSGLDASYDGNEGVDYMNPNATLSVAERVPGFDVIFAGHDHRAAVTYVRNVNGDSVLVVNGGSHGKAVGQVRIRFDRRSNLLLDKIGSIVDVSMLPTEKQFESKFSPYLDSVKQFFNQPVGSLKTKLCPQNALVGPTCFVQFVHDVQFYGTSADVSLTAPLQLRNCIEKGVVTWSDIFSIYRFENYLASLNLSVEEIDEYLEYAVSDWFNTMDSTDDELFLYDGNGKLKGAYFNFSSAVGIEYTVDVRKEKGNKIEITSVKGRKNFSFDDTLCVAVNSYRLVGGGGHFPIGVGLNREQIANRNVWVSDEPIKSIIIKYFDKKESVVVVNKSNWKVIPINWVENASKTELEALGLGANKQ